MAFVPALPISTTSLHGSALRAPCSRPAAPAPLVPLRSPVEMKKARFHQPLRPQRPDSAVKVPEDGTPIFSIFVRSPRSQIWFPLGAVAGDKRSKTLVDALKSGWGRALYQNSLDKGIAQTVYGAERGRFLQTAVRQYPQLKKSEKVLEFGYKVSAVDLEEGKTRVIDKDMALPFVQWVKKQIDDVIATKGQGKA